MGIQTILLSAAVTAALAVAAPPTPSPARYSDPAPAEPHYQFEYSVLDAAALLDFGQQERRDAAQTSGSYRVLLPDGRRQSVRYTVLGTDGYLADVTYDGEPAPRYQRPYGPSTRPRTYTLQTATGAPLAAAAETTPAAAETTTGAEYADTVAVTKQIETTEAVPAVAAETDGQEQDDDETHQVAEVEGGGYGTKLESAEQAEAQPEEPTPAYRPRPQPRYNPSYYPQYVPRHYPRYYPRYRPASRARTYYTQQRETVPSAPSTPAAPVVETVSDEQAPTPAPADQTYQEDPAATEAALETDQDESAAVSEPAYGARLAETEPVTAAAPPETTTAAPEITTFFEPTTAVYGERLEAAAAEGEREEEEAEEAEATEPIYRQDTL